MIVNFPAFFAEAQATRVILSAENRNASVVLKVVSNNGGNSLTDLPRDLQSTSHFNCKYCDLEFNHASSLSRHVKSKHFIEKKLSSGYYCEQRSEA